MAHVKENDVMIDFYLCPSLLQREILDKYQNLPAQGNKRGSLINYLKETFLTEIQSREQNQTPRCLVQ